MDKIKRLINPKIFRLILIGIFILLVVIFIISKVSSGNKMRVCNTLRDNILTIVDKHVEENNLYPTLNGMSTTIYLSDLEEIKFNNKTVTGLVTYTNYEGNYIKTLDIDDAGDCTTGSFGKETDKYNENNNVKVVPYFNYYTVETYNSKWSDYIPSSDVNTEETDGVYLPVDSSDLPAIPSNAVVTEYIRETKTYYSYRDKKWKWYKNNINYSDYSSTPPKGYTNKDTSTESSTDATEWSLDYPEEFEYRSIKSKTGYQWYKLENKEKVYWENGKYSVESPGDEYKKDKDNSAKMYSYTDDIWRWYNGDTKRVYSSLSSTQPRGYTYKDESTLDYTNWSKFKDTSYLSSENKSYREEKTDIYSRYLIKYDIYSYEVMDEYVDLAELEQTLGKSYEDISKDNSIKVVVKFKFQNEAK